MDAETYKYVIDQGLKELHLSKSIIDIKNDGTTKLKRRVVVAHESSIYEVLFQLVLDHFAYDHFWNVESIEEIGRPL